MKWPYNRFDKPIKLNQQFSIIDILTFISNLAAGLMFSYSTSRYIMQVKSVEVYVASSLRKFDPIPFSLALDLL